MARSEVESGAWVNPKHPSPPRRAPVSQVGVLGWLHANLFNSVGNTILTLLTAGLLYLLLSRFLHWAIYEAFWLPIWVNRKLFAVGPYPLERIWQPAVALLGLSLLIGLTAGRWGSIVRSLTVGLSALYLLLALLPLGAQAQIYFALTLVVLMVSYVIGLRVAIPNRLLIVAWLLSLPMTLIVLQGGFELRVLGWSWYVGGEPVPALLYGGLMLTVLLTVVGIALSFPFGVLLALGRRSRLPVIRTFCIGYIEFIRGVPLVALLFMVMIALPLVLPPDMPAPGNVFRAMLAITLFEAAYLAENVRGGLQAVPKGQYEAADALGLSTWQKLRLIVLPQALRAVIPAIVGQFISLFKDTSLVTLVGLLELLGVARAVIQQPEWVQVPGGITREVYLFAAFVYFIFSFGMSIASRRLEAQLGIRNA